MHLAVAALEAQAEGELTTAGLSRRLRLAPQTVRRLISGETRFPRFETIQSLWEAAGFGELAPSRLDPPRRRRRGRPRDGRRGRRRRA